MSVLTELWQWFVPLDPGFKFLLSLPFLVAVAAFAADFVTRRWKRM
jgi:hypothetical protein